MKRVKEINAQVKRNRRQREHHLRCITIRTNDGTNQCLPPKAWITLADLLAVDRRLHIASLETFDLE